MKNIVLICLSLITIVGSFAQNDALTVSSEKILPQLLINMPKPGRKKIQCC